MIAPSAQLRQHFKLIRTDGPKKAYEARIPVLLYLLFSTNQRLRCWPGTSTLMEDTGYSTSVITEALNWLQSVGAIYNVPPALRVGNEKKPHANTKVWQLTGVMLIAEKVIEFFYMREDDKTSILQEIADYGVPGIADLYAKSGILVSQNESNLVSQNETENENTFTERNESAEILSQNEYISKEKEEEKKNKEEKDAHTREALSVDAEVEEPTEAKQGSWADKFTTYPLYKITERKYANGKAIEVIVGGQFHQECIAIYEAWRDSVQAHGIQSVMSDTDRWRENLRVIRALAVAQVRSEDVADFVESRYTMTESWHLANKKAVSLKMVADDIKGWLDKTPVVSSDVHYVVAPDEFYEGSTIQQEGA